MSFTYIHLIEEYLPSVLSSMSNINKHKKSIYTIIFLIILIIYIYLFIILFIYFCYRDMVKRLINKMDFHALEVKMKKCKVSSGSSSVWQLVLSHHEWHCVDTGHCFNSGCVFYTQELFYLLADSDAVHEEGGVVTTSSLSVELQAGGLTQEHVDYVVDRLNHEERGVVEFLDYLTYVPLFV